MTKERLDLATTWAKKVEDLEKILINTKAQPCEWIEFTFGDGSNKATVCNDKKIIERIRGALIKENEFELAKLKKIFSEI